jgi:hypothetical protein
MADTHEDLRPEAVAAAATAAALALKVDKVTTVNTKPLSGNVALTLDDVPATASLAAVIPATKALLELGAKATGSVTLNAFGTWADGQTIVIPGLASHALKVTTTGDIDVVGLSEAAAKAEVARYLTAHAGATCSVAIVGDVLTVTALAYGTALNGAAITGTLLTAPGVLDGGASPYDGAQARSEVIYDGPHNGIAVVLAGLSSAKRYRITWTIEAAADSFLKVQANASDAGALCLETTLGGTFAAQIYLSAAIVYLGTKQSIQIVIEPRKSGLSGYTSTPCFAGGGYTMCQVQGSTSTDFTSLSFIETSTTPSTGTLTVIEETP